MQVLGQFNSGFILTKLRETLFIIDQHAADEKYRYEKMVDRVRKTFSTQRLLQPYSLNPALCARADHLVQEKSRIEYHGISLSIQPPARGDEIAIDNCLVTHVPVRDGKVSSQGTVEDMLEKILSSEESEVFLPDGTEQDLATKACRSSVMIGDVLSREKMKDIVHKMAELKHPWNCPHGRPSIRKLYGLDGVVLWNSTTK